MKKLAVKRVMTSFPHTIGFDLNLEDAKKMMREHSVRHLPVQNAGKLLGILSERDIDFAVAVDKTEASELHVEDAYTEECYVVDVDADVATVATRMACDRLGCALVVQNEKLVGIFTTVDACRTLGLILRDEIKPI